jgi:hypothetical protein
VEPHHHLHVLGDGLCEVAADLDDGLPTEHPERSGDDEKGPEAAPPRPPHEEGPGVLEDLEALDPPPGKSDVEHLPLPDLSTVHRPHRASNRHHPFVFDE